MKKLLILARDRDSQPPMCDGDLIARPCEDESWTLADGRTLDSAALVELIFETDNVVVW